MRELGLIPDGALVVHDGRIVAVGKTGDLLGAYHAEQVVDLSGRVVLPGLVDCHTHVPHAGHRYDEFELRLQGKSYLDILKAGGGILNTVRATRSASATELMKQARKRLSTMLRWGTTTAELKSGYGLSTEAESKQLQAVFALDHAMTLIPTFWAHTPNPKNLPVLRIILPMFWQILYRAFTRSIKHPTCPNRGFPCLWIFSSKKGRSPLNTWLLTLSRRVNSACHAKRISINSIMGGRCL
jgi:hypothetical protein